MDDLQYEAERGELNPRLDMVWRKDMDDWIPAGDIKGLFEKNEVAEAEEKRKAGPQPTGPPRKETKKDKLILQGKWGGSSRTTYIFTCYLLPIFLFVSMALGVPLLREKIDENAILAISGIITLLLAIIALIVTVGRFTNLGMSRWWFLSLFVPLLNIWTYSRLFACPAGYAEKRNLDGVGWLLAIIYWLVVISSIALIAATIYALVQASVDPETLKAPEDFIEILKKTYAPR